MQKQFLLFIFITFLFFIKTEKCFSQIEIQNPSFEGPNDWWPPLPWDTCFGSVDTAPNNLPQTWSLSASNGLTYCGMFTESLPIQNWESTGQRLNCPLRKNRVHEIKMDLAYTDWDSPFLYPGQMGLYGGMNRCDSSELLWLSPELTHSWVTYDVKFIPHENYRFISFWPYVKSAATLDHLSYVAIDNLSPTITVLNGGIVISQISASEIYLGECVSLTASVTDSNYTSVQWYSKPTGFSSYQLNPGKVCPKEDTKYIIEVTDTCGILSYDTVEVKIKKPLLTNFYSSHLSGDNYFLIKGIYPNTELTLYNSLGQKLFHSDDYKNDFNLSQLPSALYFYQLKTSDGEEMKGKFEVF